MDNPKQLAIRMNQTWKDMGSGKRMGVAVFLTTVAVALTVYYAFFGRTVYVPVFTGLDMNDSAGIVQKLDEMKIDDYRIEDDGATILVPESRVGRLRLDLAMDGLLPNSGKGFEIFDDAGFAVTDEDRKIMYQRALEGELARSVMSLEEVEYARIHLALPEESVFTREAEPGNATVVVKVNPLRELDARRIRAIVSLVSGAVRNVPEANVRVIDTNANLLSEGVYPGEGELPASALASNHLAMEKAFERELETGLQAMLEQTLGAGKVLVKVNADMDFDSEEKTQVAYDDASVVRSRQDRIEKAGGLSAPTGSSPVDNNVTYTIETPEAASDDSVNTYETVQNYEIGETRTHTVKAPGEVRRLSTSVVYDGTLSEARRTAIRNIIVAAVGYNEARGDLISVEGLAFDKSYQTELIADMEEQQAAEFAAEQNRRKILLYGGIAGGFLLLILMVATAILLRKGRKKGDFRERLDMNIDQPLPIEDILEDATLRLEPLEDAELEKSIKEYAEEHPEKLAELVKTWILKDEG